MDRSQAEPDVDAVPGGSAEEWIAYHERYAATSTHVYDFVWDVGAGSIGPFCRDVDGNVFLDFTSHVASSPLGYNNPKIVDKFESFDVVDPDKFAGQDFYATYGVPPGSGDFPSPAELMERLVAITEHYGTDTVFLSNSGAEAVENAIKICYDHAGGGGRGVTFDGAFHGRTLGALSLNRSKPVHRRGFPEIPGIDAVPFCRDRTCDARDCGCGFFLDGDGPRTALHRLIGPDGRLDPEEVAFVVLEPVQGEGGFHVPSDGFVDAVAEATEAADVPVIADEIQSGLGRTGEMWASDHYALEPDVICSAKAGRVGATIGRGELFPDERGRISSTWGAGDLLAAIQGSFTIDAIREHDLLTNATEKGRALRERLRDGCPDAVVDVRGLGLMVGVEMPSPETRDDVIEACLRRGLMTLGCGRSTLRLLPPLDVRDREIEMGATIVAAAADAVL